LYHRHPARPGWQHHGDPDPDRARRALKAMLAMGKIEIAELERAAGGE